MTVYRIGSANVIYPNSSFDPCKKIHYYGKPEWLTLTQCLFVAI